MLPTALQSPTMTKTGFGEHLKREREMRGVSLDEICAATRIGTRFLQAMENEEWERLPGGVFNRGFVRAVARYLGLDEEGMVAEYVMAVNQGSATPPGTAPQENRLLQKQTNWLPWIGAAIALLLIAAGWLGWHFYSVRRDRARAGQSSVALPAAAPLPEQPTAGSAAVPPATPPPDIPAAPVANSSDSPVADKLELKIEAGKATNVTVTADAEVVFDGTFIPGQSRTFEAENQFDVAAKDAGALLLELNGKTLAPIGPPGHPGTVSLTRRTLESAAGGPH
jgi:cytoskeletal protein RodZ